jgi:hypothetical protein
MLRKASCGRRNLQESPTFCVIPALTAAALLSVCSTTALTDPFGTASGGFGGAVVGGAVGGPVSAVVGGLFGADIGNGMTGPPYHFFPGYYHHYRRYASDHHCYYSQY